MEDKGKSIVAAIVWLNILGILLALALMAAIVAAVGGVAYLGYRLVAPRVIRRLEVRRIANLPAPPNYSAESVDAERNDVYDAEIIHELEE